MPAPEPNSRKEAPSKLYLADKPTKTSNPYMMDTQKVLNAPITVPLGYCLGALPEKWVHAQAKQARERQE